MSSDSVFPQRTTVVASTELANRDFRLDPTRYNERGERVLRHIRSLPIQRTTIGQWNAVSKVILAPRFKRPYVESVEDGVPFLGSSSMLAARLPRDMRLSPQFDKLPKLMVDEGILLLSCSGTIGVSVLCGKAFRGFAVSQHAARIYADASVRGYLHTYLSIPLGREVVLQQNYGKVIKELTESQIGNVVVPLVEQSEFDAINTLALESTRQYDLAREAFNKTEEELKNFLQVEGVVIRPELWLHREHGTFIKASDGLFNLRLDPHFNDPDTGHLRRRLLAMAHTPLGTIAKLWMPTRFARPPADIGYGVPFYSSADIMRARRIPSNHVSHRAARHLNQCIVEPGTIVICRSGAFGGIMGRASFISAAMGGWAVSEHMIRCKVDNPNFLSEYVFGFLSSLIYGYPLITAYRHGKDVPEIDPGELGSIPIPVLPKSQQEQVAAYVRAAFAALDRANALEDEAQRKLLAALQWEEEVGDVTDKEEEQTKADEETDPQLTLGDLLA